VAREKADQGRRDKTREAGSILDSLLHEFALAEIQQRALRSGLSFEKRKILFHPFLLVETGFN